MFSDIRHVPVPPCHCSLAARVVLQRLPRGSDGRSRSMGMCVGDRMGPGGGVPVMDC